MTTAYITHPDCLRHDMGEHHPESPRRISAIEDRLKQEQLYDFLQYHEAPMASAEQLRLVHDAEYIEFIRQIAPQQGYLHLDMDTALNPYTLDAAYRAAGAVIKGVELVLSGAADNVFCNVRPPGHHAERDQGMGFCFFNNIAVGAAYALRQSSIGKVAIFDFDVHHGNGTEHIFSENPQVLICSSFQHPNYPGKPFVPASGHIVNATLPPGAGSEQFREAVERQWFPIVESFQPQVCLISAGFDAHCNDPLAELRLTERDYRWVTEQIMGFADRYSQGRIVSSLEGGYDLDALGRSAAAHIRALMRI